MSVKVASNRRQDIRPTGEAGAWRRRWALAYLPCAIGIVLAPMAARGQAELATEADPLEYATEAYLRARYTTVESVPLPSDSAAAEQKARALGRRIGRQLSRRLRPAPPAALASTQPGVQPDGQTGNPWYKRWYVWVAVGAVVAGVATVIPFAAQRDVVELEVDWRGAQ